MRRLGRNLEITKNSSVLRTRESSWEKKPVKQLMDIQLVDGELVLNEVADDREDEPDERNGGEQDVEREGAGEKGDVVFVRGLERPPDDAGDRAMPAALTIHARGSSSSSAAGGTGGRDARARRRRAASSRRRSCSRVVISGSSSSSSDSSSASSSASCNSPRTSSTFSSASSLRLRRPFVTLRRVLSPPSVGANTNPATAPSTIPNRNAPNPAPLRSLIRPPPRHPAPRRVRPVGRRGTRASV